MNRVSLILFGAALLTACSPANTLQGSLEDEVSLSFKSVQVQETGSTVSLSYMNPVAGTSGQDIVLEIVASTAGLDLTNGGTLNLLDVLPDGSLRGSVTRAVANDSRRDFPPLVRGSLVFADNPTIGAKVTGTFSLLFSSQGGDLGAGRTVFGNFAATVQNAAM